MFELQDGLTTDKDGEYKHQQLSELSITMHAVCEKSVLFLIQEYKAPVMTILSSQHYVSSFKPEEH